MSENKHTPEPWKTVFRGDEGGLDIDAFVSNYWGDYVTLALNVGEANARRIVACVNACEGIPTEALEDGSARAERDELREMTGGTFYEIKKQRDELLAALVKSADAFWKLDNADIHAQEAEAAIASVKGGAA